MERKTIGGALVVILLLGGLMTGIGSADVTCYTETEWSYIPGYFVECVTTTCESDWGPSSHTEICNYYPVSWYWDW